MFKIELTEATSSIVVKHPDMTTNFSTDIAHGQFAVDPDQRTMLVVIIRITIHSTDTILLRNFILEVMSYMGRYLKVRVFLRLPMFDRQLDLDKLQLEHHPTTAMGAHIVDVRYNDDDIILREHDKYVFITNKQVILEYSEQLAEMLTANAFWLGSLTREDIQSRVESSDRIIMILDKAKDIPCGFGRLFMMVTACEPNYTMGYVNDVVVDSEYQQNGLGSIVNNYLMGIKKEGMVSGTLCLVCANKGTGATSAPRLYTKAGFKYIPDLHGRLALFVNEGYIHPLN